MTFNFKSQLAAILMATAAFAFPAPVQAQTHELSERMIRVLASEICTVIQNASVTNNYSVADNLEARLIRYGDIDPNSSTKLREMAVFWNKYVHHMVCRADNGQYPTQHVYKRAIEMNIQQEFFMDFFLADEVAAPFDMNPIEILSDGRVITLLDFIDGALTSENAEDRYNIGQIIGIKKLIIGLYNAKRSSEFSDVELEERTAKARGVRGG